MADSMCGPSNPLQNFQKHSSADRTLQQDRLASRASPSQGFRSSPGPNAGYADHEFEAFQAGQLPLDHGFQQQRQQFPVQPAFQPQSQPGPSEAWATDFQRMNISAPKAPLQLQQQQQYSDGWHQEFARQQSGMGGQSMGHMPGQTSSPYRYSPMSGMGMAPQYTGGYAGQQEMSIAQQKQPAEAFDEEAFDRAFEAAARAEMEASSAQGSSQEQNQQAEERTQEVLIDESAERLLASAQGPIFDEPIGADGIENLKTLTPKEQEEKGGADALQRTAAELLEKVRHDRSSKFQNSQFFELMRQFRDREAVVVGNEVVSTSTGVQDGGAIPALDRSMNTTAAEVEESIKKQLAYLSRRVADIALDGEKPFVRTPRNLLNLLHTLIRLHTLLPLLPRPLTQSEPAFTGPPPYNLDRILSELITHPVFVPIPSIRQLIIAIRCLYNSFEMTDETKVITVADEGVLFPTNDFLKAKIEEEEERIEDEVDIVQRWGEDIFTARGNLLSGVEIMKTLLGYETKSTGDSSLDAQVLAVNEQRVEDILKSDMSGRGGAMHRVIKLCEEKGIWKQLFKKEFDRAVMCFQIHGEAASESMEWKELERVVRKRMEKTRPDPMAKERFRVRRAGKQSVKGPEEMRDLAEVSVGRVMTGE